MLSQIISAGLHGIDAYPIEVQVDIAKGSLPAWNTVGLPESSVKESRERVIAAIRNCGFSFPRYRITINLAPANIKKGGTAFDLPIALGLLVSGELITQDSLNGWVIVGELTLDGTLKPIPGALAMALMAREKKHKGLILPVENLPEVSPLHEDNIQGAKNLVEVVEFLQGTRTQLLSPTMNSTLQDLQLTLMDYQDIRGQEQAKRAMMVAASGGHNLLMIGPPGTGKSMLAQRLPTILPPLSHEESLETTKVYSISLKTQNRLVTHRPFRSPHHTISQTGLIGGGSIPRPGEVSLAHNGILFLDELAEFRSNTLEVLRQPMEDRNVTIVRRHSTLTFPAAFTLIAAMNPCPCGRRFSPKEDCYCTPSDLQRYFRKISSPLLDRIDLHIPVPALTYRELQTKTAQDNSTTIRAQVMEARHRQWQRLQNTPYNCNGNIASQSLEELCRPTTTAKALIGQAMEKLGFSARSHDRILKVSRTIADLKASEKVHKEHIAEAISYRQLDRDF
jgi:magnesium chelatase family protein